MATCALCGGVKFNDNNGYNRHMIEHHGHQPERPPVRPINTSGRSKAQIVFEAEYSWLRKFLVH